MKPFDLERAKAGDAVVNQDGKAARIVCFDKLRNYCPILALVTFPDDGGAYEVECTYNLEGENDRISLHMAPVKHQSWMNVYHRDGVTSVAGPFPTEEYAISSAESVLNSEYYMKTVLMHEWTE